MASNSSGSSTKTKVDKIHMKKTTKDDSKPLKSSHTDAEKNDFDKHVQNSSSHELPKPASPLNTSEESNAKCNASSADDVHSSPSNQSVVHPSQRTVVKEDCGVPILKNSTCTSEEMLKNKIDQFRCSPSGDSEDAAPVITPGEKTDVKDKKFCDTTEPIGQKPAHKWHAWKALLNRQYGRPVQYSSSLFRYECYGSLHMVERLELMYKMKSHDGCVNALNFNASGTKLVSGSDDLDVVIWDWTKAVPVLKYSPGHRSNIFQVKFLPLCGDSYLVSCARDGEVRFAELSATGKCKITRKLAQHKGAAHKLAIHAESSHTFLSCGEDAVVFEIDVREDKPQKLVVCKDDEKKVPLYTINANPNKPYEYAVGGRDFYVRVYDKRCIRQDESVLKKFCPEHLTGSESKAIVTSVVYSYNGEEILASYNDEDIYIYDAKSSDATKFLHRYKGHRNSQTVKGVSFFGPKSEYVVSGSDCGYIFFWEKHSEVIVKYMHGDEGGVVNVLEPNPNMPVLATSGLDDDVKIWVPSCENAPDMSGLLAHTSNNMKERDEERRNEPDFADQMLYFLMQHLRRARQLDVVGGPPDANDSSSSSNSDNNSEEETFPNPAECSQS